MPDFILTDFTWAVCDFLVAYPGVFGAVLLGGVLAVAVRLSRVGA